MLNKHVTAEPIVTSPANQTAGGATRVLAGWNRLAAAEAAEAILPCCGSLAWAEAVSADRPVADEAALIARADVAWRRLGRADWQEAFDSHPRLGEKHAVAATAASLSWSNEEQSKAATAGLLVESALREANARYERKFGHIFILCARGRSAAEILAAMEQRMHNDAESEWREAGEQQRQITELRLQRLAAGHMKNFDPHFRHGAWPTGAGVCVSLARRAGEDWEVLQEMRTDADGRVKSLLPGEYRVAVGGETFRLRFETAPYFAGRREASLYAYVDVVVLVEANAHYHVPLLLTANGYTTYRGS